MATNSATPPDLPFDIQRIEQILPHRYPILLIDRVLELESERIQCLKNVTRNEPFFDGHFPGNPIMPGVLIVEALAQAAGILLMHDMEDRANKLLYFSGIEKVRFRRPVRPGDQLILDVKALRIRTIHGRFQGTATVDGELAVEAICSSTMVDRS